MLFRLDVIERNCLRIKFLKEYCIFRRDSLVSGKCPVLRLNYISTWFCYPVSNWSEFSYMSKNYTLFVVYQGRPEKRLLEGSETLWYQTCNRWIWFNRTTTLVLHRRGKSVSHLDLMYPWGCFFLFTLSDL